MRKDQFLNAIEFAGFTVENNRVYVKNDLGVELKDVLTTQGFTVTVVDNQRGKKFDEFSKEGCEFTVNFKKDNPIFATVDVDF